MRCIKTNLFKHQNKQQKIFKNQVGQVEQLSQYEELLWKIK